MAIQKIKIPKLLGRLLCLIGEHDYFVVSVTMGFSHGDAIEKIECRRCGHHSARRAPDD